MAELSVKVAVPDNPNVPLVRIVHWFIGSAMLVLARALNRFRAARARSIGWREKLDQLGRRAVRHQRLEPGRDWTDECEPILSVDTSMSRRRSPPQKKRSHVTEPGPDKIAAAGWAPGGR